MIYTEYIEDRICIFIYIKNFLKNDIYNDLKLYLNNLNDWKIGKCDNNNIIKRKQKWYHLENKYFCNEWKGRYDRWKSFDYNILLKNLQDLVQEKVNNIIPNLEKIQKPKLNSILINYYKNGNEFIAPHQDSKIVFGDKPTISILSIGEKRKFKLDKTYIGLLKRDKKNKKYNKEFILEDNSLFIMAGSTQLDYCHYIPKESNKKERYSLSFREHFSNNNTK